MAINFNALKTNGSSTIERKFDRLVDAVRAVSLNPGVGYLLRQTPNGTALTIKPGKGGASSEETCPFTITASAPSGGFVSVSVSPGTVNSLLPDNYADTFSVPDTGLRFLTITVLSDGSQVTNVSLAVEASNPAPQDPTAWALPVSATFVLGVIVDGVPYKVIGCGSIQLTGYEVYKEEVTPPAEPGEMPYTPYYAWQMSLV